jgi:hypothetical protein
LKFELIDVHLGQHERRLLSRAHDEAVIRSSTTKTIPKGQTLFVMKGNETIKFDAAEDIGDNGSVTYRTTAAAFQAEGDCSGWY